MLDVGREEGDPDLGEAGEGEIPIFIEKGGEARWEAFAETEGKGPKFRTLVVSLFLRLLMGGRTVRLRRGCNRTRDRVKGGDVTVPLL